MAAKALLWALLGLLAIPLAAAATPVTYAFTSGTLTVSATLVPTSGSPTPIALSPNSTSLTGVSFTFDVALVPVAGNDGSIVGFTFTTAPVGPIALSPTVGGVTTISLSTLTIVPGAGFVSSASGSGPYTFNMGPISVTGTATTNLGSAPVNLTTPNASGSIDLNAGQLQVSGVSIGAIPTSSGTLLLKGDFVFFGVPEPGVAFLLAVAALALRRVRMR